jgi:RimJ/RimL family protein N-acetyltransferase/8-oxo-dGTP pyrophosphatase MutT (NUDIX family)
MEAGYRRNVSDPQPELTDGDVTLRPWRDDDVAVAVAGHDDLIAHWFGWASDAVTEETQRRAIEDWRASYAADREVVGFAVEAGERLVGTVDVRRREDGVGELSWALFRGSRGHGYATRAVRLLTEYALAPLDDGGLGYWRVEAKVEPDNAASLRVATRSGLRREGVRRIEPGSGDRSETTSYVILARLASDPPFTEPEGFRALLNSFLPRKRAISQLLVRDHDGRVLICQLTYKRDWDLPGGVVEVGESPQLAAAREVSEELALDVPPGDLLLTDWLPPWSGWDDAVCLVFDGGAHDPGIAERIHKQEREIRHAEFATAEQVRERCADFTARRIESALANLDGGGGPAYVESGGSTRVKGVRHPST